MLVEQVWRLERGVAVTGTVETGRARSGMAIRVIAQGRAPIDTVVAGTEAFDLPDAFQRHHPVLVLRQLTPEDVPVGTRIISIEQAAST